MTSDYVAGGRWNRFTESVAVVECQGGPPRSPRHEPCRGWSNTPAEQQLSRLENGLFRRRLDHLKPFADALGYSPEQILLWSRYPGTSGNQPR